MLSSLPPLGPPDAHSLWYPSLSTIHPRPPPTPHQPRMQPQPPHHPRSHPDHPPRTLLTLLRADELAIAARKSSIRRFGAAWLRPPGITKTLQGTWDERVEREEQEAVASREMAMLDAQAAVEAEGTEVDDEGEGEGVVEAEEDEGVLAERDLDDDVPEAEAWVDDAEDLEEGMPVDEGEGDYTFGADGVAERELDEEVPEAEGSYQHTDTELEDESSEGEGRSGFGRQARQSMASSGAALGSSVFGSSPVMSVGGRRSDGMGSIMGREN